MVFYNKLSWFVSELLKNLKRGGPVVERGGPVVGVSEPHEKDIPNVVAQCR